MSHPGSRLPSQTVTPALDRFERLYRMLLESIPSSILLIDPHMRVVSANRNFISKSRIAEAEVTGRPLEDVVPPAIWQHLHLRVSVGEVFRTGHALRGGRVSYRAPGLATRIYYYSLVPFRWEDRIEYVMLLMEDVTEKVRLGEEAHRAERHLASVVESANDLVVSMDVDGRVLTWNTAAARITGYEESEVRNCNLCELCLPSQGAALRTVLAAVPSQGRTDPVEVEMVSRGGGSIPISWVCSPMKDTDSRVRGVVAVGRDLTERRKFEAQLLRSEKLAALGVMAGGIAHEIRNPLAVVSAAAQMLLEMPLAREVQQACAGKIHQGVQRIARVVESLLRFARPSNEGAMTPLNLIQVVREASALVAGQLRVARVELRTSVPPGPVHVRGNAGLLQQLLTNLLLNALNALPGPGGEIRLSLEQGPREAILRIADTGRGIRAADLPKVFDPFFTTMPVGQGTGLGLSICYAIVQQHDGKIDIASEEGKGATVTVLLPLEPPEDSSTS
jgi:PAS domain S-box-containing protein